MKKLSIIFLVICIAVVAFIAGYISNRGASKTSTAGGRKILYYHDPMHPAYKSDKPGIAPDCGMQLEPVYADEAAGGAAPSSSASTVPAGAIKIGPDKQQIIGLRVAPVERTKGNRQIRTLGRVAVDENRLHRIIVPLEGLVKEIYGGTTGSLVTNGQLLASIDGSNRDLLNAEQTLFTAVGVVERYKVTAGAQEQLATATYGLRLAEAGLRALGMSDNQIFMIERNKRSPAFLEVRSPANGVVLARNIFPSLRFDRTTELYRIANLDQVWIMADMFENEAALIRPGSFGTVTLPHQKMTFRGTVSSDPPQFDPTTRTQKVRLEVQNTNLALRPDMFVDVEFQINAPSTLTVPTDALLDTGLRKMVFVDRGEGYYEPRQVQIGWRTAESVEIVKGLMEGERIVTSGTFLIDSESRMKAAAAGITGTPVKDPVCGMDVDETKSKASGKWRSYAGSAYYFCSDNCRQLFDRDPKRYVAASAASARPAVRERTALAQTKDPVCGMAVDAAASKAAGLSLKHGDTIYYFCTENCKQLFEKDPTQYVGGSGAKKESDQAPGKDGADHD